jgi:hypothetical protein
VVIAVGVLALVTVLASCDSGSSNSQKKPPKHEKTSTTTSGAQPAAVAPVGGELAVADYLKSQGLEYAGDCAKAKLPRDKGKWCSTLVSGDDKSGEEVYDIGPVGSKPVKRITVNRRGQAKLTPGDQVAVGNGAVGTPQALTLDQLRGNVFITGNLILDQQAGIGNGVNDITTSAPSTGTGTPTGGGTGGTGTGTGGGTGGTVDQGGGGTNGYPPSGGGIVVEQPTVPPGGKVGFSGSGCGANETLQVSFDGKSIGTVVSAADGTFGGDISIPPGTAPGVHTLRVQGAVCVFSAKITVGNLAFTGASNHTSTYVLGAAAAIVLGWVLIVGARRRRRIAGPTGSSG